MCGGAWFVGKTNWQGFSVVMQYKYKIAESFVWGVGLSVNTEQGRAETFGGAGAQNIKGAHENMKQGFK